MNKKVLRKVEQYEKKRKRRKIWKSIMTTLGCIVVFVTTYMLILPAITLESDTYCGMEAHEHDDKCYVQETFKTMQLVCTIPEGLHEHGENCYVTETTQDLTKVICGAQEQGLHIHTHECYSLTGAHTHTEECYTKTIGGLICTLEESEGHQHSEACTQEGAECGLEESEGHVHTESCYEVILNLICELEESEGTMTLSCGVPEEQVHEHTESCYETISQQICVCTLSTEEAHTHTESCYEEQLELPLTCTLSEDANHTHGDRCYGNWILACEKQEHIHSKACYADLSADIESSAAWEATFANVEVTGVWVEDVLGIAQSQMGYHESLKNYIVLDDGETTKGYSRYGDWYADGYEYGDWCAMFVSFCLHYGGVYDVPLEAYCPTWINLLEERSMYNKSGEYVPVPGDIIFFDWEGDGISDHVGLVETVEDGVVGTIEGNSSNRVQRVTYNLTNGCIMGYGHYEQPEEKEEAAAYNLYESGSVMYLHPDYISYQDSAHKVNGKLTLTYVLIPEEEKDTWQPDTLNWDANTKANYVVTYCANRNENVSEEGSQYLTYRIQEHEYYKTYAEVLAGIVGHAYPFISEEEMRSQLKAAYEAGEIDVDVSCCVPSDYIAAAQWAIWDMTGLSGTQTTVTESTFPNIPPPALNPLTNVGHTDDLEMQTHIKAIRDWLVTQSALPDIEVAGHESVITQNEDGSYRIEVAITLNRPLEEKEEIFVSFNAGENYSEMTFAEEGADTFTVLLESVDAKSVVDAQVYMEVSIENMQVYVYDSNGSQDMISGQWGTAYYDMNFNVDVEKTSVDVTKYWSDNDIGADYIEVSLYADGVKYGDPVYLNAENGWTHAWENLLKYSAPDVLVDYDVKEVLVPGYLSAVTKDDSGSSITALLENVSSYDENGQYLFTYSSNGITKALADAAASGGSGLTWIVVDLTDVSTIPDSAYWTSSEVSADGSNAYMKNKLTGNYLSYDGSNYISLSGSANSKTYFLYNHFYHLKGNNNQYLIYLDQGVGYTTTVWDDALTVSLYKYSEIERTSAEISFTITNTKSTEMTSIQVTKAWEGREDEAYPESVDIILLQNGVPYGEQITLNAENEWSYTWEALPSSVGDQSFEYSVEEIQIKDYDSVIESSTGENGEILFKITNTWNPEYVPLILTKVDAKNPEIHLEGAVFDLYLGVDAEHEDAVMLSPLGEDYGVLEQRITMGTDGTAAIDKLWVGQIYYLVETDSPTGYRLLEEPIKFTTEKDEEDQIIITVLSGENGVLTTWTDDDGALQMHIQNFQEYVLPETGGIGTHMYTIGGALLVGLAMILLLCKYKLRRKEDFTSS